MKIFYDHDIDAVYIKLGQEQPEGVTEMAEGVNLDLTPEGKVVGIEILDASKKIDIQTIFAYSLDFDKDVFMKKAA